MRGARLKRSRSTDSSATFTALGPAPETGRPLRARTRLGWNLAPFDLERPPNRRSSTGGGVFRHAIKPSGPLLRTLGAVAPSMDTPRTCPDRWTSGHNGSQTHRAPRYGAGQDPRLSTRSRGMAAARGEPSRRSSRHNHCPHTLHINAAWGSRRPTQSEQTRRSPQTTTPLVDRRAHVGHDHTYACQRTTEDAPIAAGNLSSDFGCVNL